MADDRYMKLFINGQQADVTLENEKTIGDVLSSFQKTCEENSAAVIGISVNGKNVSEESFDSVAAEKLTDSTSINFDVITKQEVVSMLKNSGEIFSSLAAEMENLPAKLQLGKDAEARGSITKLADVISEFCNVISFAMIFPETISGIQIDGKKLPEFFSEFQEIFSELEGALSSNDTVLIGDLAGYEICPRLQALNTAVGEME